MVQEVQPGYSMGSLVPNVDGYFAPSALVLIPRPAKNVVP